MVDRGTFFSWSDQRHANYTRAKSRCELTAGLRVFGHIYKQDERSKLLLVQAIQRAAYTNLDGVELGDGSGFWVGAAGVAAVGATAALSVARSTKFTRNIIKPCTF